MLAGQELVDIVVLLIFHQQSKLARAETNSEQLQGRFDNMNEEAFVFMRHAIALSDRVLTCTVAAYLELQACLDILAAICCMQIFFRCRR